MPSPKAEIVQVVETTENTQIPNEPEKLELGQWYWITPSKRDEDEDDDEAQEWFGCIVHVGSNYVEMSNITSGTTRIHITNFDARCRRELNPDKVIGDNVKKYQGEVNQLMARVVEVTARLGVQASPELASGSETQALATVEAGRDFGTYKTELVKAKKEVLPDLFKQIESTHHELANWMKASIVPFKAQVGKMKGVIGRINDRIFNVDLYAGLSEQVELIQDGEPAGLAAKIHLLQRRCYMDEECLAQYQVGGMEFKDLHAFDAWLCRPDNLARLLPFPRCIVAFKVRRDMKARSYFGTYIQIMELIELIKQDEYTFLFIRNGERVYRMGTELEFGAKLFPDMDRQSLTGKLWASGAPNVDRIITDDEFQGLCEDYAQEKAEHEAEKKAHEEKLAAWEATKKSAKERGFKFKEEKPHFWGHWWEQNPANKFAEFEPNNIYYDDIRQKVDRDIQHHNRIGLIIQGFLDRSQILHPHPPWKIWSAEGFRAALELVYDDSRALVAGAAPDFEEYRKKANESIKTGSVTVGQEDLWELDEGAKAAESDRRRGRQGYHSDRYTPYGNPGPGILAKVASFEPRRKRCTYAWFRKGQSSATYDQDLRTKFTCGTSKLLNVEAYKPGDFHAFFDDPRTRAEYLQWAPLLLEAEEYHAGNREVKEPPPPKPKKESSWEGQRAYRLGKLRKSFEGKAVIVNRRIETKGGTVYEAPSLWRVTACYRGEFTIQGVNKDGTRDGDRWVRGMQHHDFEIDPTVPDEPEKSEPEETEEEDESSEETVDGVVEQTLKDIHEHFGEGAEPEEDEDPKEEEDEDTDD